MLTLIALSAVLMQEPPAPPAPPELHARVMVVSTDGPGGLDKDGDGEISREEFAAPMNDHFARIDRDGDGRLSTEEMAASHGPGENIHPGPDGEGGPGVRRLDLHRSGGPASHAEHEVRAMTFAGHGEGGPGPHNVAVRLLGGPAGEKEMDADNDGRISEAEFTGPLRDAFTRMDADHSGFIEQGERGPGHDIRVVTHRVETRQNRED